MITDSDIKRAASGDEASMGKIYSDYSPFVWNVALKTSGNPAIASDATQEVFLKIFKKLRRFRFKSSIKTWIYRITVNTTLNIIDKEKRREGVELKNSFHGDSSPKESFEEKDIVNELLRGLDEKERILIVLREIEGLSYKEIASASKMKLGTVKTKIYRAREKIRELYKEKYS